MSSIVNQPHAVLGRAASFILPGRLFDLGHYSCSDPFILCRSVHTQPRACLIFTRIRTTHYLLLGAIVGGLGLLVTTALYYKQLKTAKQRWGLCPTVGSRQDPKHKPPLPTVVDLLSAAARHRGRRSPCPHSFCSAPWLPCTAERKKNQRQETATLTSDHHVGAPGPHRGKQILCVVPFAVGS